MPSVRGFYRVVSMSEGVYDDLRPFVDLTFNLSGEQPDGIFPPFTLSERFTDLERAHNLITSGERVGIMLTQWLGNTAITMIAKESELPATTTPRP